MSLILARNFGGRGLEEEVRGRSGRSRGSASPEVRDTGVRHYVTSLHVISLGAVRVSVDGAQTDLCARYSLCSEEFQYDSGEYSTSIL